MFDLCGLHNLTYLKYFAEARCNELILLVCSRLAQKIVCSSHPIYRSVRKHRVRMATVGFILVLLMQRVYGWVGLGISLLWFHRLLMFLVLACRRWLLCLGMAASARLSTHYFKVACRALDSQRVRP